MENCTLDENALHTIWVTEPKRLHFESCSFLLSDPNFVQPQNERLKKLTISASELDYGTHKEAFKEIVKVWPYLEILKLELIRIDPEIANFLPNYAKNLKTLRSKNC